MHQSISNVTPTAPELKVYLPQPGAQEMGSAIVARPLTANGDNTAAVFSPDGSRLLFLSRNRPAHRHAQVYELILGPMIEKRITFHDGDDSGISYYPTSDHVLYSSSTDELKEEPALIQNAMRAYLGNNKTPAAEHADPRAPMGPSELYRQTLDGREIERLTDKTGFDGDASLDAKGARILFTSSRFGAPNLYFLDARGLHRLTTGEQADRFARFSPDGRAIAWTRFAKDLTTSQLMLAEGVVQKAQPLTGPGFLDLYPAWDPKGEQIVFSSNRGGKGFDLYVVDRQGQCLKRLTEAPGDELRPAFSPDGAKLVFSGNQSGSNQIYMMDYRPSSDCITGAMANPPPPSH